MLRQSINILYLFIPVLLLFTDQDKSVILRAWFEEKERKPESDKMTDVGSMTWE